MRTRGPSLQLGFVPGDGLRAMGEVALPQVGFELEGTV